MKAAIRSLLRTRKFTAFVVIILALGIAANTIMFTIVHAVLLRDLPFRNPDRLVWIWSTRVDRDKAFFSIPNFSDTRSEASTLEDVSAFGNWAVNLTGSGEAERLQGVRLSANAFQMLGVRPAAGRLIASPDGRPGSDRVVVISHSLWQRRFGASAAAVGSQVSLNGDSFTIIGVLPTEFVLPNADIDVASPLVLEADGRRSERGSNFLRVFGRLKDGASVEQARAELSGISERLRNLYPDDNAKLTAPRVQLLADEIVGSYRTSLWILFAAVAVVLAIVCANLANLVIVRAAGRRIEVAIRIALGARRGHLAWQLLTECALLGLAGGSGGLAISWWLLRGIGRMAPRSLPRISEIAIDWQVLLFAAVLSIVIATALALLPALTLRHGRISETLKVAGRSRSDSPGGNARSALVVVEVALSLVLMIAAGLLVRSFVRLQSVDSGVVADHLLVTRLSLPSAKYANAASTSQFVSTVLDMIRSSAVTSALPLSGINSRTDFIVRGHPPARVEDTPGAQNRWISSDYFKVMGIPLKRGRHFEAFDREGSEPVAIVDEALGQRFMRDNDPVGESLVIDFGDGRPPWSVKIVGVAGGVKHFALDDTPTPTIYFPLSQVWSSALPAVNTGMTLVVKTAAEPLAMAETLRRAISRIDADVAVSVPTTMTQILASAVAPRRFNTLLMEGFAGAGLVLSMTGLYAVLSYSVAQKRYEIGVRIALGADRRNIVGRVMFQGLRLALVGSAVGLVAALAMSQGVAGMLDQTETVDPAIYGGVCLLLVAVTAGSSYFPAAKAASTDPLQALRDL